MTYKYDVFISYNSNDKDIVEEIINTFSEDVSTFFDDVSLTAGKAWQEELEEALDSSSNVIVFLGKHGLGRWQNEELRVSLDRRTKETNIKVIPILLPGVNIEGLPQFIKRMTWVDFREGLNEQKEQEKLFKALGVNFIVGTEKDSLFVTLTKKYLEEEKKILSKNNWWFIENHEEWLDQRAYNLNNSSEKYLSHALNYWLASDNDSFIIIGEAGSGKSTFLYWAVNSIIGKGRDPIYLPLHDKKTLFDEIDLIIEENVKKYNNPVLLIDNLDEIFIELSSNNIIEFNGKISRLIDSGLKVILAMRSNFYKKVSFNLTVDTSNIWRIKDISISEALKIIEKRNINKKLKEEFNFLLTNTKIHDIAKTPVGVNLLLLNVNQSSNEEITTYFIYEKSIRLLLSRDHKVDEDDIDMIINYIGVASLDSYNRYEIPIYIDKNVLKKLNISNIPFLRRIDKNTYKFIHHSLYEFLVARQVYHILKSGTQYEKLLIRYMDGNINNICSQIIQSNNLYLSIFNSARIQEKINQELMFRIGSVFAYMDKSCRKCLESIPTHDLKTKVKTRLAEAIYIMGGNDYFSIFLQDMYTYPESKKSELDDGHNIAIDSGSHFSLDIESKKQAIDLFKKTKSANVKKYLASLFARTDTKESILLLKKYAQFDNSIRVRRYCIIALGYLGNNNDLEFLFHLFSIAKTSAVEKDIKTAIKRIHATESELDYAY